MICELDPEEAESCYEKGMARMELDRHRKAIENFDHCISLNPGHEFVSHDQQIAGGGRPPPSPRRWARPR